MRALDFENEIEVSSEAELKRFMMRRYEDGLNEFWLWHEPNKHRTLAIGVKGDLACLSYSPKEYDPGFMSVGSISTLDPDGTTIFRTNGENLWVVNWQVVPFDVAFECAREFLHSDALPSSIEWCEL